MLMTYIGPGPNSGPGENFSLKLLISTCQMVIPKVKFTYIVVLYYDDLMQGINSLSKTPLC